MNILDVKTRKDFYSYLMNNHLKDKECFVYVKMGDPKEAKGIISYIDAVEVALCFGWIDSTKKVINSKVLQRFSPRNPKSKWTLLNVARVNRLIKRKEMTKYGLKVCKDYDKEYKQPIKLINSIKKNEEAYKFFISTPKLYQNIRLSNIDNIKDKSQRNKAIKTLINKCQQHKTYGSWNDYGRLN